MAGGFGWGSSGVGWLIVGFSLFVRLLIGLHPYSGEGQPPMHGDYEAQRHWMEITLHTPIREWYVNTTTNDLQYWGLDYPPLTAYQSLAYGAVMHVLEPPMVALGTSRGYETPTSRRWMRYSVLVADAAIFLPAAVAFVATRHGGRPAATRAWSLAALTLLPAAMLIDHGHFQYNGISLGLALAAAAALLADRSTAACVLYVCAFNHKHMALYYAPAMFGALLGTAMRRPSPVAAITALGVATLATQAALWAPLVLWPPRTDWAGVTRALSAVVTRLVPLQRGIFEDHVANFWCATSPVAKWKRVMSSAVLARWAAVATLAAASPSMVHQILRPSPRGFLLALLNSSLAFFLFAYQVHEKNVLLPLLPAAMLAVDSPELHAVLSPLAAFSIFPLLRREGLGLAYVAALMLSAILPGSAPLPGQGNHSSSGNSWRGRLWATASRWAPRAAVAVAVALHAAREVVPPPPALPHLHDAAHAGACFVVLGGVAIYANWLQWTDGPTGEAEAKPKRARRRAKAE